MLTRSLPLRSRAAASAPALDLIPFRVEAGSRGRGIPQGAQRLRICRESPLTLPERPSLWLWGWERRERSDRRPQPPSLTAASVGSPEGQSPFGPSAAETNPLASGEALTPRERSDRQQGAKRSAGVAARADERKKLERLCRYISRPAVSEKRLSLTRGGNVRYQLKTPYRDGTTHVIFEPLDFIARLAALVPKPRVNLTRFHGVFAPNSRHRALVTPAKRGRGNKVRVADEPATPAQRRASMTWAQRLKRVFNIDIETCSGCGGAMKVIACIEDPIVIKQILDHLKHKAETSGTRALPESRAPPAELLLGLFD